MYYVYEHWRPDKNIPFYVGKGKKNRAYRMTYRNARHVAVQKKLASLELSVEVKIVACDLSSDDAIAKEIELIANYRKLGIDIVNMTIGGDGIPGHKHSEETRENMRASALLANTDDVRKKKSLALIGLVKSPEHRAKLSRSMVGNKRASGKRSMEFCQRMREALKGRKLSPEQIEQRRASMLLVWERRKSVTKV